MFESLQLWGKQKRLPIPVVQTVCDVHSQGIDGVKQAFLDLATRKAIGKIVLRWRSPSKL